MHTSDSKEPLRVTQSTAKRCRVGIVSYGLLDQTLALLRDLKVRHHTWEICLWDNRSEASTELRLKVEAEELVDRAVWCGHNVGFARAVNGIASFSGSWDELILINPDVHLLDDLSILVDALAIPATAAVGGLTVGPDGLPHPPFYPEVGPFGIAVQQLVGIRRTTHLLAPGLTEVTGWLEGSLLAISRTAWEEVGAFDEQFFLYSEEQDWQKRARNGGWSIRLVKKVLAIHHGAGTTMADRSLSEWARSVQEGSRRKFIRKWWGRRGLYTYLVTSQVGAAAKRCWQRISH